MCACVHRRVIILVQAGAPVDSTIEQLCKYMEPGDIIIDGGNEWCAPTPSRTFSSHHPPSRAARITSFAALRVLAVVCCAQGKEFRKQNVVCKENAPPQSHNNTTGMRTQSVARPRWRPSDCVTWAWACLVARRARDAVRAMRGHLLRTCVRTLHHACKHTLTAGTPYSRHPACTCVAAAVLCEGGHAACCRFVLS
jgi:NAD binding domain of 6-phosphogluconate dehydrogenase